MQANIQSNPGALVDGDWQGAIAFPPPIMASKIVGLVAPLPPQVGGVAAFAQWVLAKAEEIGFEVEPFDLRGSTRGIGGEMTLRALARQALLTPRYLSWLRGDFALVHYCVSLTPTGLARDLFFVGLARARGKGVIAHIHNVSDLDCVDRSCLLRNALRLLDRWADSTVVIARIAEASLRQIGVEAQCLVLAQRFPLPTVKRHLPDREELLVLFAGAVGYAKGLDDLIRAISDVRTAHPSFRLIVVGNEARRGERSRLEELVRALNLEPVVEFHSAVEPSALRRYYEDCDIVCLPSKREGFPMVLLEAMAFGLPPVATNVGGIPELVEDGVTGFLIEPGDIEALGVRLATLTDAAVRNRLGQAASERAAENGNTTIAEAWRSLYTNVEQRYRAVGSSAS